MCWCAINKLLTQSLQSSMFYWDLLWSECHVRGEDSAAKVVCDDEDDDDPSQVRLILQTKDSKAKKCSLIIGKVGIIFYLVSVVVVVVSCLLTVSSSASWSDSHMPSSFVQWASVDCAPHSPLLFAATDSWVCKVPSTEICRNTGIRCGGKYYMDFIENLIVFQAVEEFWKFENRTRLDEVTAMKWWSCFCVLSWWCSVFYFSLLLFALQGTETRAWKLTC